MTLNKERLTSRPEVSPKRCSRPSVPWRRSAEKLRTRSGDASSSYFYMTNISNYMSLGKKWIFIVQYTGDTYKHITTCQRLPVTVSCRKTIVMCVQPSFSFLVDSSVHVKK